VIVSELKPSFLLKSFATSIENRSFGCFISTAKLSLFSFRRTVIFFPERRKTLEGKQVGRPFVYVKNLTSEDRIYCHTAITTALDRLGDGGMPLFEAVEATYRIALAKNFVEKSPFWEAGRLFDPLKRELM